MLQTDFKVPVALGVVIDSLECFKGRESARGARPFVQLKAQALSEKGESNYRSRSLSSAVQLLF